MKGSRGVLCFIGGGFGVGKSTLCEELATRSGAQHLRASELVGHVPIPQDETGKVVADIHANQQRLLLRLGDYRQPRARLLLDGHFVLLGVGRELEQIGLPVFEQIAPDALILVSADPDAIAERLRARGWSGATAEDARALAAAERVHAIEVQRYLGVPLLEWTASKGVDSATAFVSRTFEKD